MSKITRYLLLQPDCCVRQTLVDFIYSVVLDEFPCMFFHKTECKTGNTCKFSHEPLNDETGALLEKVSMKVFCFCAEIVGNWHVACGAECREYCGEYGEQCGAECGDDYGEYVCHGAKCGAECCAACEKYDEYGVHCDKYGDEYCDND